MHTGLLRPVLGASLAFGGLRRPVRASYNEAAFGGENRLWRRGRLRRRDANGKDQPRSGTTTSVPTVEAVIRASRLCLWQRGAPRRGRGASTKTNKLVDGCTPTYRGLEELLRNLSVSLVSEAPMENHMRPQNAMLSPSRSLVSSYFINH